MSPLDPLAAELTLLHAAKEAWQEGRAQSALDLVQKHARLYPHSQLASEREALRVFALCGLGRTGEARDAATMVLAKAPGSPFRSAIEESCAMRLPK
jgi:RNA polymerase sigma-70 factor (ECF subfamily)